MKHFLMCLLYIAALGVLSFVVGRLIPKHWFHADRFPWVCHPAEQKLWKRLHVRKWQAKIPDMSRIFVKIMPEKKLTKENYENLPRMIEETCVAEWTHILLSIAGLGLLKIWSGVGGVCITIIYIVLGNLPFIFDKFYQVDGSHKAEGNGLGLALVKRIVDSAGGTIKAENREYGGCRFVIELPKQKDEII